MSFVVFFSPASALFSEDTWSDARKYLKIRKFKDLKEMPGATDNEIEFGRRYRPKEGKFEIRVKFIPLAEVREYSEVVAQLTVGRHFPDEDESVVGIFQQQLRQIANDKEVPVRTMPAEYARKHFDADAILSAKIDGEQRKFGGDFKHLLIMMVHKHAVGNLIVLLLQDDMDAGEKYWIKYRDLFRFKPGKKRPPGRGRLHPH